MDNNIVKFDVNIVTDIKNAIKNNYLFPYLRSLSQDELIKVVNIFSSKEQHGDNKIIRETAEFLIIDKSRLRKK